MDSRRVDGIAINIPVPRNSVANLVGVFRFRRVVVGFEIESIAREVRFEGDKQFDESLGRLDMEHGFFATVGVALGPFWCKAEKSNHAS